MLPIARFFSSAFIGAAALFTAVAHVKLLVRTMPVNFQIKWSVGVSFQVYAHLPQFPVYRNSLRLRNGLRRISNSDEFRRQCPQLSGISYTPQNRPLLIGPFRASVVIDLRHRARKQILFRQTLE